MSVSPPAVSSVAVVKTTLPEAVPTTFSRPPSSMMTPVFSVNLTMAPSLTVRVTPLGTTTQLRTRWRTLLVQVVFDGNRPHSMATDGSLSTATPTVAPPEASACQPSASAAVSHGNDSGAPSSDTAPSSSESETVPCASRPPKSPRVSRRRSADVPAADSKGM